MFNLILWDIDGTLIESKASKIDKHYRAFEFTTGKRINLNKSTAGMTDLQILLEFLSLSNMDFSIDIKIQFLRKLNEITEEDLFDNPSELNPAIESIINKTYEIGWVNGIFTGNTPERAGLKIKNLSISSKINFEFGFFGDKARNRFEMLDYCYRKITNLNISKVILVGDTPLDIMTAQSKNLPIVAVATGNHKLSELKKFNPTILIENFENQSSDFISFLESMEPNL